MSTTPPRDWKMIEVNDVLTFWVPPDAEAKDLQPIDSIFGVIKGSGYEIVYDYGRFAEQIESYEERSGYSSRARIVSGQHAQEVSFQDTEENLEMPVVRILQVPSRRGNTFTLRISCMDEATCEISDNVFDSITFN